MDKGFYPTQARVIFLFEQPPCRFHIFYLENLFISIDICLTAYVELKAKVKIHGVKREKERGLPRFFIKKEDTKKLKKERAIRTMKAGVIEGDADCPGIICCSIYDTNPVHFLTISS